MQPGRSKGSRLCPKAPAFHRILLNPSIIGGFQQNPAETALPFGADPGGLQPAGNGSGVQP